MERERDFLELVFCKRKKADVSGSSSSSFSENIDESLFWTSSNSSDDSDLDQPMKKIRIEGFMETTLPNYSDMEYKEHFRLCRNAMSYVESLLQSEFQKRDHHGGRPPLGVHKGAHFFVWYLANQETFREVCDRFNVALSTGFDIIKKVSLKFKNEIGKNHIKFPKPTEFAACAEAFKGKGLINVIGAIDGSYIPIRRPQHNDADYVNRKGYHSVLLQAVCTSDKKFIDIYVGEPGSLHDARVLRRSPLYKKMESHPHYMGNYCLLGDSAYPLRHWLVPPYKNDGLLTPEQERFNYKHSATRVVIENAFGLLKGRFRRLRHFENMNLILIINCIISACVLHNICLEVGDEVELDMVLPEPDDEQYTRNLNTISPFDSASGEDRRQQLFDNTINHT